MRAFRWEKPRIISQFIEPITKGDRRILLNTVDIRYYEHCFREVYHGAGHKEGRADIYLSEAD